MFWIENTTFWSQYFLLKKPGPVQCFIAPRHYSCMYTFYWAHEHITVLLQYQRMTVLITRHLYTWFIFIILWPDWKYSTFVCLFDTCIKIVTLSFQAPHQKYIAKYDFAGRVSVCICKWLSSNLFRCAYFSL